MKLLNEKGLTLAEVLAALALSSIILILAYSIFFTSIRVSDSTINNNKVQKEAVYISLQLDQELKNINKITPTPGPDGKIRKFTAFDIRKPIPGSNVQQIPPVEFKIDSSGNLFVGGKQLNSNGFSLAKTTFTYDETAFTLTTEINVKNIKTKNEFNYYKVYQLQGE